MITPISVSAIVLIPQEVVPFFPLFPLLYVGPDQIMPLTSILGAIVGVLLMFWNRVVGAFARFKSFWSRR